MKLLAALCFGVFAFFAVGFVTGRAPRLVVPRRKRPDVTAKQRWLHQAGVALTPHQFLLGSVMVGMVTFLAVAALSGTPMVALVPAIGVGALPRAYFSRRRAARLRVVQEAWPDGLRDVLASVSAGRSVSQAVVALAATGPEPLREAFARYPLLARMLGTVPALEVVKEELGDPTSDRVIEVLVLAHERGGQIVASILEDLVQATTKDLKLREEIASEGLEMKINSRAVLVMPWLVLFALTMSTPAFREFYSSALGGVVVLIGGCLSLFGLWFLQRLNRPAGEERVFASARAEAAVS
ncbi:MAG: type II secretion system F family protein [Acidimicrobiia bacterium]